MTAQPHQRVPDDLHPQRTALRDRIRSVYKGFPQLSRAAFAPGNRDRSVKELIALAIGVVQGATAASPRMPMPQSRLAPPNNKLPKRSVSPSPCAAAPPPSTVRAPTPPAVNSSTLTTAGSGVR